jgi:hypothetical protein
VRGLIFSEKSLGDLERFLMHHKNFLGFSEFHIVDRVDNHTIGSDISTQLPISQTRRERSGASEDMSTVVD